MVYPQEASEFLLELLHVGAVIAQSASGEGGSVRVIDSPVQNNKTANINTPAAAPK